MSNHHNLQPLGGRVLVERHEEKEQIKDGIIVPDSAKERSQEGTVIAIGTGKKDEKGNTIPFHVKAGDRVLLSQYGGNEVNLNGKKCVLLNEDDILAILK